MGEGVKVSKSEVEGGGWGSGIVAGGGGGGSETEVIGNVVPGPQLLLWLGSLRYI